MMSKINELLKKYKIVFITACIVLLTGIIALFILLSFINKSTEKHLNEKNYALTYDNTWKVKEKRKDEIKLKHNNGEVNIQIKTITDDSKYATIDEFIDLLLYNFQKQNSSYKLLSKNLEKITKDALDGYKLFFEDNEKQVMITVFKKSDKIVVISFLADSDYFDILLASVDNIIYNLDIKDVSFNVANSLKLETTESIDFKDNEEFDKLINNNKTYKIAANNYMVEYSIPDIFTEDNFDSTLGIFSYGDFSNKFGISVHIFKGNIYEYLDKNEIINVYGNYSYYHKEDEDSYSDFKESLSVNNNSKLESFIYKNSYYDNNAIRINSDFKVEKYKKLHENAELIYALNNYHILVIKIESSGQPITEKLINSIKVLSSTNYSSNIQIEKEGNYLIGRLKGYSTHERKNIKNVTLKIPDTYKEIDWYDNNMYLQKYYYKGYNEDMNIYDNFVKYELTKSSEDAIVKIVNSSCDSYSNSKNYKSIIYTGELTSNGKKFKTYSCGYTKLSGIMFTNINRKEYYVDKKLLIYSIEDGGNLYIEIDGNGHEVTDDFLNELTNFTIEEEKI